MAPAAAIAVGDAIMPTSRVKSTGKPAHGWFSVNVSVNGSVTVIDFTLLASTVCDDDREARGRVALDVELHGGGVIARPVGELDAGPELRVQARKSADGVIDSAVQAGRYQAVLSSWDNTVS